MAATGNVSGVDGGITFVTGYVVSCTAWSLDITVEDVDLTALGDDWRSHMGGLKEWSGSFDCQVNSVSFTTLSDFDLGGAASDALFQFDATAGTDGEFSGTIVVTGMTTSVAVGSGASTATFTFVGSGALTITPAA